MEIKEAKRRIGLLDTEKRKLEEELASMDSPKLVVEQEDAKRRKQAKELEWRIKLLETRKKYLVVAMDKSIDLAAAQQIVEKEEREALKEKLLAERPAGDPSLPPLPVRCRPHPKGCDTIDYFNWLKEYDAVLELNAEYLNLPTLSNSHKDRETVSAVVAPNDKKKLLHVADAVVSVAFPKYHSRLYPDREDLKRYMTGVIISWDGASKRARILTYNYFEHMEYYPHPHRKICVRWPYMEETALSAELLFFSSHYMIALLEVVFPEVPMDVPLLSDIIPSFGSSPGYGQEVFALARDKDLSLMVRRGTISEEQTLDELCHGYLFVDYELPECGIGGPVVDCDGDVVGLAFPVVSKGISVFLPISIALICVEMWTKHRRVARPLLGMCFRNMEVTDEISGEDKFVGFVVDEVDSDSPAWVRGIRSGNMIVSINEQCPTPLPEFERMLLSYGWGHLEKADKEVVFKLEVEDAPGVKRSITLPLPFYDAAKVNGLC